ncbi:MAG TPA: hypothetical protein VMY69_06995 [Phycisphaerae bacterium]|nr:hypothetical protein [Phycisphaerae bacterium]
MVRFSCACGKRLQVGSAHAGRAVQCPSCGAHLTVPHPQEAAAHASEALAQAVRKQTRPAAAPPSATMGLDALAKALQTSAAGRRGSAPSGLPTGRPPAGPHSRKPLIIGFGAAAILLVLLVILSAFFGGSNGNPPADEPAKAGTTATSPSSVQRATPTAGELFKNVPFQEQKG